MLDADQMVHEIALAYAQSLYLGQLERKTSAPGLAAVKNKSFLDLYIDGTKEAMEHMDKIKAAHTESCG